MSIMETNETKTPVKKKAKKKKAAPKTAIQKDDRFAGMTVKDCCSACNINGCVISGKPYCAHPRKCGLQPAEMSDSGALTRRKDAERRLRDQLLRIE